MTVNRPHENCYWVAPGKLMAGEYPSAAKLEDAYRKLSGIVHAGVRHFIDVTEQRDLVTRYDEWLPHIAQAQDISRIGYDHFALPHLGVPETPQSTNTILDRIDELNAARKVVYLHGWGGAGRTATIAGCWLVRHGMSGDDALRAIAERWASMAKRSRYPRSPETPAQERYICTWAAYDFAIRAMNDTKGR